MRNKRMIGLVKVIEGYIGNKSIGRHSCFSTNTNSSKNTFVGRRKKVQSRSFYSFYRLGSKTFQRGGKLSKEGVCEGIFFSPVLFIALLNVRLAETAVVPIKSITTTYTPFLKVIPEGDRPLHRESVRCSKRSGARTGCDSPSRNKGDPPSRRSCACRAPDCSGCT